MSADEERHALWDRVYAAAARMLWAQPTQRWWGTGWPEERKRTWQQLEVVLTEQTHTSAEPDEPSNPTQHLLVQRSTDNRPITLVQGAERWRELVSAAPVVRHPKHVLARDPLMRGEGPSFYPGACLLLHHNWWAMALTVLRDLKHRMAPGRPGYTVTEESRELSHLAHRVAAGLREPFTGSTPRQGEHPWIATAPSAPRQVSAEEVEQLCAAARAAALQTPTRTERRANHDLSVSAASSDAAAALLRILSGDREDAWVEVSPDVDPARYLAHSRGVEALSAKAEEWRVQLFGPNIPPPYTPTEQEYSGPAETSPWAAMSREVALVLADVMDEFSARITPGRTTSRARFDSFPISHFYRDFERYLTDT